MYSNFNSYSGLVSLIYNRLISLFSYYYACILLVIMGLFLLYRFPYCYSPYFFTGILWLFIFSSFMSLFMRRLVGSVEEFFSGFVPVGTPLYICPLVCLAETISYVIRPFVLVFRPFINISLGCAGAVAVGGFCFSGTAWLVVLTLLFFYEVFVALVHWFIVTNILSFSIDH